MRARGWNNILVLNLFLSVAATGCGGSGLSTTRTQPVQPIGNLILSSPGVLSAAVSGSLNSTLQVSGGTAPYFWSLQSGTLPTGVTLSSAGVLSGTPTAMGDTTVTVSVSDSSPTPLTSTEQVALSVIPTGFTPTLALDEEFNEATLNTSLWDYRLGVRDQCTQDPSAVAVANGYLRLSTYTTTSNGAETHYCGAIDTSKNYTHTYGYWEAAVRFQYQPAGQCSWWIQSPTNGQNLNNPQASGMEMDVFEHTGTNPNALGYDHALHWDGYKSGIAQSMSTLRTLASLDDGNFHVFGVAWTPAGYTFYVDGQITWTVSNSQAPASSAAEYIIVDTELPSPTGIPAAGFGPLGASTNAHIDVDYVRIYPYIPGNG